MREQGLAEVFVELADTLVDEFDVIDFLHQVTIRCAEVLEVAAVGILLADQRGALQVAAASSEQTRILELLQLQTNQGPCPESFQTARAIAVPDIAAEAERWPRFSDEALAAGFQGSHALPMRLRSTVIGALNLFMRQTGRLPDETLRIGQALADVATIGLLQARSIRHHEVLAEQLQTALNSRVIIEQAKGVLAERYMLNMDEAFIRLRAGARGQNTRLSDLARGVVAGTVDV
ncbi:GAF and ANTAR domain-containing protein [Phytomonospora endophytica]|uniref:Transcriptional regulator with GAF, ATPase, and Fis domain n=1 Tax=Phytomonospora endophytica TaxID=714109 RepID=A0A841FF65_9ACTN|nr:GAF and ANTAR domain-containing protein [Phytomonospora endophytica]MBB6033643.1 transcriptional regulator with GAF, ATPase, and Fis domain [Phytomonospora endophytica]GIG64841.1 transcriptional regulator [Phytomonospora endophytica]